MKFDADGGLLWKRQPGSGQADYVQGVATDEDGNVYIVGFTEGSLGGASKGDIDAWLIKLSADGRWLWKRQPGTGGYDVANAVATDPAGNVYVVGMTSGELAGPNAGSFDAWLVKFDADGRWLWQRQPRTSSWDYAGGVATDAGGAVYVVGGTYGALYGPNEGGPDGWVIKFDNDGHRLWTRQRPATFAYDDASGVGVDSAGNVHVVGQSGGIATATNNGDENAWVLTFDAGGHELRKDRLVSAKQDRATGIAIDAAGNSLVVGYTFGALAGSSNGSVDAFIAKFPPAIEP